MKILSVFRIRIERGGLAPFTENLYSLGCNIQRISREEETKTGDLFEIEVIHNYSSQLESLEQFVRSNTDIFELISTTNILESTLTGGLLQLCSKVPIENINDFQMKIQGSLEVIKSKIAAGKGTIYSGISNNAVILDCLYEGTGLQEKEKYERYCNIERDSAIINRFSGINAFPLIIRYSQEEDLIKTINNLETSFSVIRFHDIENIEDISAYELITAESGKPVISSAVDEMPLYLLIEILKLFKKNKLIPNETNIGIIGINLSAMRLTRLLIKLGCLRVLGYDHNEKLMMAFEKTGGLATTAENIFSNSDFIFLIKNHFTIDEFHKISAGQLILSLIDEDELERSIIEDKGILEYVSGSIVDTTLLIPGLMKGLLSGTRISLDDKSLLKLAEKIHNLRMVKPEEYSLFGSVHARIAEFMKDLSEND